MKDHRQVWMQLHDTVKAATFNKKGKHEKQQTHQRKAERSTGEEGLLCKQVELFSLQRKSHTTVGVCNASTGGGVNQRLNRKKVLRRRIGWPPLGPPPPLPLSALARNGPAQNSVT